MRTRIETWRDASPAEWNDWRWQTRHRIQSVEELRRVVPELPVGPVTDVVRRFPIGVSPYYLSLADLSNSADPILRQILPDPVELEVRGQETGDPFAEESLSPVPGVIHRYVDRALLVPTNYCATLCRHCFRKRTWADGFFMLGRAALDRAVAYVRDHVEIRDVLITGGDPLHLRVERLAALLAAVRAVEHVEVIRVASRVPVTLPQRIDDRMVDALREVRPLWFITHFNHVREVTPDAVMALRRLIDAGITVQNQSVLLRGVNDSTGAQVDLSRAMLRAGVRPYYLHLADPVAGAGHYRVPIERGVAIVRDMFGKVAGFGIPRLVVDLPGGGGKVPVMPDFVLRREENDVWFESPIDGRIVRYQNPS